MSGGGCVVVCGGSRADRVRRIEEVFAAAEASSALLVTASPSYFRAALPDAFDVRDDNPAVLATAYAERLDAPAHAGPAMLLRDRSSSLARSLSWEYLRRAAESEAWDLVVRELDGAFAALDELAAPRTAAAVIEELWPRNARFAALAAAEHMDPAVRDAHEIAGTIDVLDEWLSGASSPPGLPALRVEVAGADAEPAVAAVSALMGVQGPGPSVVRPPERIAAVDGLPAYRLQVSVPSEPDATPVVIKGELQLRFAGVPVTVALGGLLARCKVRGYAYRPAEGESGGPEGGARLELEFVADPVLWPESLLSAHSARTGK